MKIDMSWMPGLRANRDGKLVIAASAVRSFGYGFMSVFLGIYVNLLGFSPLEAGFVFSGIMAGGALSNVVASWRGDTIGRRRMLIAMSCLMVLGGVLFTFTSSTVVLVMIGLVAMTTSTGGDRTAFLSIDTAILAQSTNNRDRTIVFTWYNLLGVLPKAGGSLLIALAPLLQSGFGLTEIESFRVMLYVYAFTAAGGILLYARLSPEVETQRPAQMQQATPQDREARGIIAKLCLLFSLDAFGGGLMTRAFLSFWFVNQFGASAGAVASIFFVGQLLNVVSVALAAPVARMIGLVNTMAFTQMLSNSFIAGMVFAPFMWLAVLLFFLRELTNDMDVPTRQSYTMAIVPPESRTAMAGMSNLGRTIAQTVSPTVAGVVAQVWFLGAPFLLGPAVKGVYNILLYFQFRSVKPPEETEEVASSERAEG